MDLTPARTQCTESGGAIPDPEQQDSFDFDTTWHIRHHELLNSNDPPLDAECPFIESVVSRLRRRLAAHDDKISQLRAQLERLDQERNFLATDLSRNTAILSPMRRMPPEILSEIFTLTLPSDRVLAERGRIHVQDSPWVLTHICGRWRMVAIASSSLWSFIGIDCDVSGDLSAAFPLPLLAAQLQRATHLRVYFDAGPYLAPHVIRLFQLIVEHSPRWEELYLVPLSEMFPIIATLHDRIPLLRKLWLEFNESEDFQNESEDNIECFRLAPALRDASLIFLDRTLTVPLPGHRLTRYQLNGAWEDHSEILKVAKNLAEVRIFVCDPDTPRLIPGGVIELCELRRLYVSDVDILDSLRLPALQDLGFFQEVGDPDAAPHIDSVVVRSACILRRLCVMGFPGADMITELLRKHQAIVELSVILADPDSSVNANALIGYLANRGSDDIFSIAPQLGGVFFGCQNGNSLNYQYYHDMLLSRWKSGALKCAGLITAAGSEPPPPSILHCLDTLRADGLNMLCVGGPEAFDIMSEWTLDTYL